MTFAEWLMAARKRHPDGLTQSELSERSGVSQQIISSLETGETKNPRLDTAIKLFGVLGEVFLPPNTVIAISGLPTFAPPPATPSPDAAPLLEPVAEGATP